jgi:hypothetical protein
MAVEERVRDLESEVKVLKNEIQAVLLNIQDQVLTYYATPFRPDLGNFHADDGVAAGAGSAEGSGAGDPSYSTWEGALTVVDRLEEGQGGIPAPDGGVTELEPEELPRPRDESQSLVDIVKSWTGTAQQVEPAPRQSQEEWLESLEGDVNLALLAKLATWANAAVNRMGGKRAKAILETYVMTGLISSNVARLLEVFVTFEGRGKPAGKLATRDVLTTLMNLDKILGRKVDATAVALSLLLEGD